MWLSLAILLAFTASFSVADEYRAAITSAGTASDVTKLYITSDYSNVAQQQNGIQSRLILNDGPSNPQLLNKRTCTVGFDPTVSSTFNWTSSFPGGVYGTDTIVFGDPIIQPNTKLRILNDDCNADNSLISLRPSRVAPDFTFIGDYLRTRPDNPIAVMHYDTIGPNGTTATTATITLGGPAADLCSSDWTYIPSQQLSGFEAWAIQVDQITYNKNFLTTPKKAKLSIDDYNVYFPEPYFTQIAKQLKISTDGFLACNVDPTNVIIFAVNDSYIRLGPSEYLDQSTVLAGGLCKSRIKCQDPSQDYFTVPFTFFKKHCLLLDYKNKMIGISLSTTASTFSSSSFVPARN